MVSVDVPEHCQRTWLHLLVQLVLKPVLEHTALEFAFNLYVLALGSFEFNNHATRSFLIEVRDHFAKGL